LLLDAALEVVVDEVVVESQVSPSAATTQSTATLD